MHDLLALNRTEITSDLLKEASLPLLKVKYKKIANKIGIFLLAVMVILFIVIQVLHEGTILLAGEAIVLLAVYGYVRFFLLKTEQKRIFASMAQNGSLMRENCFYEDGLRVVSGYGKEDTFSYRDIESVRTTKRLIILQLRQKKEIILAKNGFEQGSWSAVCSKIPALKALTQPGSLLEAA